MGSCLRFLAVLVVAFTACIRAAAVATTTQTDVPLSSQTLYFSSKPTLQQLATPKFPSVTASYGTIPPYPTATGDSAAEEDAYDTAVHVAIVFGLKKSEAESAARNASSIVVGVLEQEKGGNSLDAIRDAAAKAADALVDEGVPKVPAAAIGASAAISTASELKIAGDLGEKGADVAAAGAAAAAAAVGIPPGTAAKIGVTAVLQIATGAVIGDAVAAVTAIGASGPEATTALVAAQAILAALSVAGCTLATALTAGIAVTGKIATDTSVAGLVGAVIATGASASVAAAVTLAGLSVVAGLIGSIPLGLAGAAATSVTAITGLGVAGSSAAVASVVGTLALAGGISLPAVNTIIAGSGISLVLVAPVVATIGRALVDAPVTPIGIISLLYLLFCTYESYGTAEEYCYYLT